MSFDPRKLRSRRGLLTVALTTLLLILAAGGALSSRGSRTRPAAADRSARGLATQFLAHWVEADGRVVRRDQGGDTVSEGQAYGMLLALVAGDRSTFDAIWTWTRVHLQQPTKLLAWRWTNGHVADEQAAADADLDTAWALSLAGTRFHEPRASIDGAAIADAALAHETIATPAGRLLVAGPWAVAQPATLNPSYLTGGTASSLSRLTGNHAWDDVATATRQLDTTLLSATALPPDWASLQANNPASAVTASGSPDHSTTPQYGLDAPRLLIRLAASCNRADRALAASTAANVGPINAPALRSLTGKANVTWRHPITDVAAAAVRSASGDSAGRSTALIAAQQLQTDHPTYYGAAWVALGTALLTTDVLSGCPAGPA